MKLKSLKAPLNEKEAIVLMHLSLFLKLIFVLLRLWILVFAFEIIPFLIYFFADSRSETIKEHLSNVLAYGFLLSFFALVIFLGFMFSYITPFEFLAGILIYSFLYVFVIFATLRAIKNYENVYKYPGSFVFRKILKIVINLFGV